MEQVNYYVVHYYANNNDDYAINNLNTIIFRAEKSLVDTNTSGFNDNTYKFVQDNNNRLLRLLDDHLTGSKKELLNKTDNIKLRKLIMKKMHITDNCYVAIDNSLFRIYCTNDLDFLNELDEAQYIVIDKTNCSSENFAFEEAIDQTRDFYLRQYDGSYIYKRFKKFSDYKLMSIKDREACSRMHELALKLFNPNGSLKSSYFFNKDKKTKSRLTKRNQMLKAFTDDYEFLLAYQEMQDKRLSLTNNQ
ncbi:MAG: hypothetical protein J5892_02235 [Bacilli bacterium]|nr:hypothetical protein [Bacilli bacterium]